MLRETGQRLGEHIGIAGQRRQIGLVDQHAEVSRHGVDLQSGLEPDAHREMAAPGLRRGYGPDEIGAGFEHQAMRLLDFLALPANLASP